MKKPTHPNDRNHSVGRVPENEDEWKQMLTPEQYAVLREKGTEAAFTGEYVH